jgi:hypothetical protein
VSDDPKNEESSPADESAAKGPVDAPVDAPAAAETDADDDAHDAASPAAILKRVSALDEDDDVERLARAEEAKLAARRSANKKPKKKSGLEAAASKRLAKIGAKAPVKREVAVAADADPLLLRATDFSKWAEKNQQLVAGIVIAAIVVIGGGLGYSAYEHKRESDASMQLAKAVEDERGRIGDPDKEDEPDRPHDPTPVFKTVDERREAALAGYRGVEAKFHGTGAATLARLSEGSLLLDKEDADGALAAYTEVSTSPLAKADAEVRGRALEGMGFAYELKADAASGDAAKPLLEKAGKEYRELENTDVTGFKELGMYHEARVLQKQGSTGEAVAMLKKLHERIGKEKEEHPFVYLEAVADDALRSLAPDALPAKSSGGMGGFGGLGGLASGKGGKPQLNPAQLQKLQEQLKAMGHGAAPGGAPK